MKRVFLTILAAALSIGQVHAADLLTVPTPHTHVAPQLSWTGFYAGLAVGWAGNTINGNTLQADGTSSARTVRESADQMIRVFNGGLYLGGQKQVSSLAVLGLEGDFSMLGGRSRYTDVVTSGSVWAGQPASEISYHSSWLATGRVKMGLLMGQAMVYATGGVAFSSERETRTQYVGNQATSLTDVSFIESDRKLRTGHVIGGGAEWRLAQNWSIRGEYLHASFGRQTFQFPNARGGVIPTGGYLSVQGRLADNHSRIDLGRIGISYHF